jgi:roadblock/LC7 domain-containing protein
VHHLLNIIEYFASLRSDRRDDAFTAKWKFLQLRAWASLLLMAVALVVLTAAGSMLDTLEANAILRSLGENLRPGAAWVIGGGTALICLFAMYSWVAVVWFAHRNGAE